MATKNYMTLANLTTYDGLIKQYIGKEDAKSIKYISVDGNTVSFYKSETGSGTPDYTVTLPDVSGFIEKIASAEGNKIVVSTANGEIEESDYDIDQLDKFVTGYHLDSSAQNQLLMWDDAHGVTTSEIAYDDVITKITDPTAGSIIVSDNSGNLVESSSITEDNIVTKISDATAGTVLVSGSDGGISESGTAINDLATQTDVADAIEAYVGTIPAGSEATTIVGYVDEVVADAASDADISLVEAQTPTTGYLKTYELYQGGNAAANLVGKIDIPKDLVVTSGEIVVNPTGQPAGTYLKLTIANQTAPVYINVADLCDVYTAQASAAQVQLAISATNEISATIVAGSVTATELASNAVTTAKIANDAVTADKVAISAHTEAQTAGADGVAVSVTTTDGQVSAVSASIAANTYDAHGAAATAKSEVIGASGDAASANTVYGAKAYADAATNAIATADIQALFA